MSVRDLIIIGAGPAGLAVAISATQAQLDYQVLEKGLLANSIFHFPPQMTFFTTPDLLEIGGLPFVTPYEKPTRHEALRYYRRVVETYRLQIAYGEHVLSIEREPASEPDSGGDQVFAVTTRSSRGVRRVRHARSVVLAIGYYDHPNWLGIPGEDLPHVAHYYGDPHAHYQQRVVIVGGKNSAAIAALELFRGGAHVTLVHRRPTLSDRIKYWIRPDIDNRIKEGSIAARFNTCVKEIRPTSVVVTSATSEERPRPEPGAGGEPGGAGTPSERERGWGAANGEEELPADAVLLLTGYHPDFDLLGGAGVALGPNRAPVFDPETLETNVPGLFVAGGMVGGLDTGAIFIENGRFHGDKIVKAITDREATRF
jgi:thioredoxin reductase (NADPH)